LHKNKKIKVAHKNSHTTIMDVPTFDNVSTFDSHLNYSGYLRDPQIF